ncbi:MAG: hypothetical protein LBL49_07150 [Clostridiales Family XIII bacterium]|nr:hypothetical protein [Clostridiales Family XIII bacterium]
MRKKAIFFSGAAVLIALALFVVTSASENSIFSVSLNRDAQTVTVSGSGFEPGEMISLLAAYNSPDYANPDYIDQLTADGDGDVSFTFPSREDKWLGGHTYYVALNGATLSTPIYTTSVKVHSSARVSLKLRSTLQLDYEIDGASYAFTSSNTSILKVSADGVVTPQRAGSAIVTLKATDGSDLSSSLVINVTP